MKTKPTPHRYFWIVLLALLVACTPAQPNETDMLNTAIAMAQTSIPLTLTALPTVTPPAPTVTPSATVVVILPTPPPTQPPVPILTPDAIQVERWKEYQTELARVLLSGYSPALGYAPDLYKYALCEWDILGRSNQEVYVWAVCAILGGVDGRLPAAIHLELDGSVQNVEVPEINNSTWDSQILRMFPADVREKFGLYTGNSLFFGRIKEMMDHINYRETHPEEPPLVVLSAIPTAIPTP